MTSNEVSQEKSIVFAVEIAAFFFTCELSKFFSHTGNVWKFAAICIMIEKYWIDKKIFWEAHKYCRCNLSVLESNIISM